MSSRDFGSRSVAVLAPIATESGGAERFYQGLFSAIREKVGHAELISLPADESTWDAVLHNYEQWRQLDVSSFDLVISTKAPTFVVNHPRQVLYLVHTMRVFYDMFEETFPGADEFSLKCRKTIHSIDTRAIARIARRFAIGHEVASRLKKWNGIDAEVLHPALGMDQFRHGECGDYFLLPGRLHRWKRVDLAIKAVLSSDSPLRLTIAGSGEAESELKSLARNDPRIAFLGQVTDEELVDLYASCLAVVFVPVREDYGYVTLEAFKSGKPVITCSDSGEPTQFVEDGVNGLVVEPEPESLALAMEKLLYGRDRANEMGAAGKKRIAHISWSNIADALLEAGFSDTDEPIAGPGGSDKIRIAILDMQPIDPPVGGGRLRLLGLYHALGSNIEARYVGTYDWPGERFRDHKLSPTLREIDVPLAAAHFNAASELSEKAGGKTVIDLAFSQQGRMSPEYLDKAVETVEWADIVVFSHPWVYPLVADRLKPSQAIVYDSQNVEGFLRAQILDKSNPLEAALLRQVVKDEFAAGERAQLILTCSQADADLFARVYGWPAGKMIVVPNGVMVSKIQPPGAEQKSASRAVVGLSPDRPVAIFMGSAYPPNLAAAGFIANELAAELPEVDFVIAGGVTKGFPFDAAANVFLTGYLEEDAKLSWLQASDIAINPMFSGSGTNIKMFDFMAAGMPILTTPIGARGIADESTPAMRIASRADFARELRELIREPDLLHLGQANRSWVERDFAWEKISRELGSLLSSLAGKNARPARDRRTGLLRIVHVTTAGHKCGIGEYTLSLVGHFPKARVASLICTCETLDGFNPLFDLSKNHDAMLGWEYDNIAWSKSKLRAGFINEVRNWSADAALIQYHRAFFSEQVLEELCSLLLSEGIIVAVVTHRLNELDLDMLKKLQEAGVRLVSHSEIEIENTAGSGLNFEFLPIGVEQPLIQTNRSVGERDWNFEPPVIATTGFLRKHKGIANLVRAMGILQEDFPGSSLSVQCALYPSADSGEALSEVLRAIRECELQPFVSLETEFLPIEKVREKLRRADLAVLPYEESDEGGSASAVTCFESSLPLIVSKARIFHEIRQSTLQLDNIEPVTIAKSIAGVLSAPNEYKGLVEKANRYARTASWESVTERLIEILRH